MEKNTKKIVTITAVLLLMVLACGCGAENEKTSNRTSAALTRVSKNGEEASDSDSGTDGSGASGSSTENTIKPSDSATTPPVSTSGTVTATPEVTETPAKKNYVITPITEGLCEQLPASELGELAAYNAFNRLESNARTEIMVEYKVCVDDVTGVVYYVNVGRDYFIYRIKDGKSELAVELPANYLYTHEGVLYFLLDAQNILHGLDYSEVYQYGDYKYDRFTFEGMNEGDIYSYTPATGKVELVYPAQAIKLKVTDEGIYYLKGDLDKNKKKATELEWYYLPFDGTEPEKVDGSETEAVWNGYRYDRTSDNILRLTSDSTGTAMEVATEKGFNFSCVYKDELFMLNSGSPVIFKRFDLLKQEEIFTYNLTERLATTDWAPSGKGITFAQRSSNYERNIKKYIDDGTIYSKEFALTDDSTLWFFVNNSYLCSVNLETGATQLYYCPITEYMGHKYIGDYLSPSTELYTDGRNLYVIRYYPYDRSGEPALMRLVFEYEEATNIWYWDVTDKIGVND